MGEEKIVQNKSYEPPNDYTQYKAWAARSQKFAIAGAVLGVWGRSSQLPEVSGGLGAKPLAAGGTRGLGAEPPALENFAFFFKNNLILGLY